MYDDEVLSFGEVELRRNGTNKYFHYIIYSINN